MPTVEPTAETVETTETEPTLAADPTRESAATAGAIAEPNKSEGIDEKDAEKLREIATIWWNEYYPEQLQALLTQMYAWKAPGNKYETAVIVQWLEGEDAEVCDRINQLISLKNNRSQLTTDEGTETDYDE